MNPTLELSKALLARRSITPTDEGCQELLGQRLAALGFHCETLQYGDVTNTWARYGEAAPLLVFAGHTDVVPPGPLEDWDSDPFQPVERDGYLYGRGAADMKSSLAAMLTACERFLAEHPQPRGSIAFLLTSDEEGPAVDGTVRVIEHLQARNEVIDYCLVGEPSSSEQLGDVIKNGRRGSLSGRLSILGRQGHVAYPEQVLNPIHASGPIIAALSEQVWDRGNAFFPATSFQISNMKAGTGATNVVPGAAEFWFNFRFSTEQTEHGLRQRTEALIEASLARINADLPEHYAYTLHWDKPGPPFLTEPGVLVDAARAAIKTETGLETVLSTGGGTSDGRFIAPTGAQVVELGPVNATIHKVNERVLSADLEPLSRIYQGVLTRLLV
jgi:succinyl-diaminopimelate desuccinylase